MATTKPHVVVIGAGVTGLTSSVFLSEAGYKVTTLAKHFPGDESIEYTSPWAGAHWRTSATSNEPMVCDWDVQTFDYWLRLLAAEARDPSLPRSGLKMQTSYHFWDTEPTDDLWWSPYVQDFRQVSTFADPVARINGSQPDGTAQIKWAAVCGAPSLDVPTYLSYLVRRAKEAGVKMVRTQLPTEGGLGKALETAVETAGGKVDCIVNATGLGARKLCGDTSMFPIKGQTVLVKGEAAATRTRIGEGYSAYCIPRPGSGTTILGGTKDKGDWNPEPNAEVTRKILERNRYLAPELLTGADGGFEVVSVQCGRRPGREGGPRVEKEDVEGKWKVVHAYGHASGGYQNSIGSARMVVGLVDETLSQKKAGGGSVTAKL